MSTPETTDYLHAPTAVAAIRNGQAEAVLTTLYKRLLPKFLIWASRRFAQHEQDLPDVFQDVLLAFYESVEKGRFPVLQQASLQTYLFNIGFFKLIKISKKRFVLLPDEIDRARAKEPVYSSFSWEESPDITPILRQAIGQLSPACHRLLTFSLLEQKSNAELQQLMEYKDQNTTAAARSRCLAGLKSFLKNNLSDDQLDALLRLY